MLADEVDEIEAFSQHIQDIGTGMLKEVMVELGMYEKYVAGDADTLDPAEWEQVAFKLAEKAAKYMLKGNSIRMEG
jgi:hypothetical protein